MNPDSLTTIDDRFQSPIPRYTLSEDERQLRALEVIIGILIARTKAGETWDAGFADAEVFLEAVPLATPEFVSAMCRLHNALFYCRVQEFGAATFELRVVRGILQKL